MNKNERMNTLNNSGIDTSKYFNFELPNGLKAGSTITVTINENGLPIIVSGPIMNQIDDPIANQIIEDGYVRNTKLHRRFVMAQMFKMLNYKNYDGSKSGFDAYLRTYYSYGYMFDMMTEEVKVLSKLEVRDYETFTERSVFFNKNKIVKIMEEYLEELEFYVNSLKEKHCKGAPYKTIHGNNIFVDDLNKKIYWPVSRVISDIKYAKNYNEIYRILVRFNKTMVKLPAQTKKSKTWIDTYKGEGAFYTMKNLIMFHGCCVLHGYNNCALSRDESMEYINNKIINYNVRNENEGWRIFGIMRELIKDNNFDFNKKMNEIYNK